MFSVSYARFPHPGLSRNIPDCPEKPGTVPGRCNRSEHRKTFRLKGSFRLPEASSKNIAFRCARGISRFRHSMGCPPIFIGFHGGTGTKTGTRFIAS
jgi:hypothetical protein